MGRVQLELVLEPLNLVFSPSRLRRQVCEPALVRACQGPGSFFRWPCLGQLPQCPSPFFGWEASPKIDYGKKKRYPYSILAKLEDLVLFLLVSPQKEIRSPPRKQATTDVCIGEFARCFTGPLRCRRTVYVTKTGGSRGNSGTAGAFPASRRLRRGFIFSLSHWDLNRQRMGIPISRAFFPTTNLSEGQPGNDMSSVKPGSRAR